MCGGTCLYPECWVYIYPSASTTRVLGWLRQEDHEFKASLGCTENLKPEYMARPHLKNERRKGEKGKNDGKEGGKGRKRRMGRKERKEGGKEGMKLGGKE
jgi:hypothetical protein